jgi:hypothetical protein
VRRIGGTKLSNKAVWFHAYQIYLENLTEGHYPFNPDSRHRSVENITTVCSAVHLLDIFYYIHIIMRVQPASADVSF